MSEKQVGAMTCLLRRSSWALLALLVTALSGAIVLAAIFSALFPVDFVEVMR